MQYFKSIFIFLILFLASWHASANYILNQSPKKIYGAKYISFGIDTPQTGEVCNYFGRHFRFDATTESGKNMLSMLMAAELANRKINVWYIPSIAPDTDHQSGCVASTMAVVTAIGLVD